MNTFGVRLRLSTFGESHGEAIGGILDGFPAGLKIDRTLLKQEMTRRQGGRNLYSTQRKEDDIVEILSGVFDDTTLGTPIGFIIKNNNTKIYEALMPSTYPFPIGHFGHPKWAF